jgi:hypothetical protein
MTSTPPHLSQGTLVTCRHSSSQLQLPAIDLTYNLLTCWNSSPLAEAWFEKKRATLTGALACTLVEATAICKGLLVSSFQRKQWKIQNDEFMLLLRSNLLVDSAQAQLCSGCQSFAMAPISATLIFRIKVRNKQFEAKQTSWMLTESITRALQTRIPILGSETRCARLYLACLVTLVLGLRLRLAPRKRYFVMYLN